MAANEQRACGFDRAGMLEQIKQNIQHAGYHLYIISGDDIPRYAYTIGLRESLGAELILGGGIYYMQDEALRIVHSIREQMNAGITPGSVFPVEALGAFTLHKAHKSWVRKLMLGALDYYDTRDVDAFQIVPDEAHWTIDTPDMQNAWSTQKEPVWRGVDEAWPYKVPRGSTVSTNLDALRGARITEVARWGEDDWEMFAGPGPDVLLADFRVASLDTLLAADPSLAPVLDLEIGKGLWRDDSDGAWNSWGSADDGSES